MGGKGVRSAACRGLFGAVRVRHRYWQGVIAVVGGPLGRGEDVRRGMCVPGRGVVLPVRVQVRPARAGALLRRVRPDKPLVRPHSARKFHEGAASAVLFFVLPLTLCTYL